MNHWVESNSIAVKGISRKLLPFRNPIPRDLPLHCAFKSRRFWVSQSQMFRGPALHPCAPFLPIAQGHLLPHQFNDLTFGQSKLKFDGLKRRAVFPSHLNDSVNFMFRKRLFTHFIRCFIKLKCGRPVKCFQNLK